MPLILPESLLTRPATRADAQAIFDINLEHELVESPESDSTVSDVFELWDDEQMNLEADTCVITTEVGELVGYTGVAVTSRGIMLDVHTKVRRSYPNQDALQTYLLNFADMRAHVLLKAHPELPHKIYTWSFTSIITKQLEQHGYTIESSDYRMEITLNEPPVIPQPLEGIVVRPFVRGEEERAVYDVIAEAFLDIDGKPYHRPYAEWYESVFVQRGSFEPSMFYVAVEGSQVVGTTICRVYPENGGGFISQVAVRRAWRKRGIARNLLYTAMGEYYRRGIQHIVLDVDSSNRTGAQELYRSVGMYVQTQVDFMINTLSV